MHNFNDGKGAEIGMCITCQRCKETIFLKQTGYGNLDHVTRNTHTFYDVFESKPDGWDSQSDIGWLCPNCNKEYERMINNFKHKKGESQHEI